MRQDTSTLDSYVGGIKDYPYLNIKMHDVFTILAAHSMCSYFFLVIAVLEVSKYIFHLADFISIFDFAIKG